MSRLHTAAALAFVALIPLVPFGFWVYARAASVDRSAQVAHARRLLVEASPLPGARNLGFSVYENRAWNGENLVPISSYTVETAYRLPHALRPPQVVAHYKRKLTGWRVEDESADWVAFGRDGDKITLDIVEYRDSPGSMREYGVMVSQ
jgi:hypothetical protein